MKDDMVDIKRDKSYSSGSSSSGSASSAGNHGRQRYAEKLVDKSRRTRGLGLTDVDNGARISEGLANTVALKACQLKTRLKNPETDELSPPYLGQAGLIQMQRLTDSPGGEAKRRALPGTNDGAPVTKASALLSSRFAVVPTTCVHNVENEEINGVLWKFERSDISVMPDLTTIGVHFEKAGHTAESSESIVLMQGDGDGEKQICWDYYDVTVAPKIENPASPLTLKNLSFRLVERTDYHFQVGQKIGVTIYRRFELTAEDAGMPRNSLSTDALREIFGYENRVNIYTGEITQVAPNGETFQHNINTFRGCSGALIFLLDVGQDGYGVNSSDYGKAVAVHVGGERFDNGKVVNFAFKLRSADYR